jgi:hypothetical protein
MSERGCSLNVQRPAVRRERSDPRDELISECALSPQDARVLRDQASKALVRDLPGLSVERGGQSASAGAAAGSPADARHAGAKLRVIEMSRDMSLMVASLQRNGVRGAEARCTISSCASSPAWRSSCPPEPRGGIILIPFRLPGRRGRTC